MSSGPSLLLQSPQPRKLGLVWNKVIWEVWPGNVYDLNQCSSAIVLVQRRTPAMGINKPLQLDDEEIESSNVRIAG